MHVYVTPTHRDRISICFKLNYVGIITCIEAFNTHENATDSTSKISVIKMSPMHDRIVTFTVFLTQRSAGLYHYCDKGN